MKNLIKKALFVSLTAILTLGMVACGNKNTQVTDDKTKELVESTLDKDVWIVGLDDAFAPMGFRDQAGEIVGFDVDLAKAFGEKMGKEIKFQPIDWTMKEVELGSGNIDFIWNGYTITEDRQTKVSFSNPYLNNKQVIVTLADSDIKTKADLAGKNVGAQSLSSAVTAMEKEAELYQSFKGGKAITFADNNQALMDLEAGRIDAVVADEILVKYYITLKGAEKYTVLEEDFGDEEYGVGIRKDDQRMVNAFNAAYEELKAEGKLAEISQSWFGEDITN